MNLQRRTFLASGSSALVSGVSVRAWGIGLDEIPVSGRAVNPLRPFDDLMLNVLRDRSVPGASLAVARHGEILLSRGYGWADREAKTPVQPDSIFRIASVSKPITATAVICLVQQGKLKLDEPVLPRLLCLFSKPPVVRDTRWEKVTVRHCLQHRGGWDRNVSFDPIARPDEIANSLGIRTPVAPDRIVEYMFSVPLDFEPGARAAYSNFGYIILGRLIAIASGRPYEEYVAQQILNPLKCKNTQLGRARRPDRLKGEVIYYDRQSRRGRSLYPADEGAEVDLPFGAENFEAFEAHGGWTSTAADLLRFASVLLPNPQPRSVLSPASIALIKQCPEGAAGHLPDGRPKDAFNGLGWMVRPVLKQTDTNAKENLLQVYGPPANLWHSGFIAGTEALLVHRHDNLQWCVLFNTQSTPTGQSLVQIIDPLLHQAAAASRFA